MNSGDAAQRHWHAEHTRAGPPCPSRPWGRPPQTLQLWTQVVGKVRLARTPWVNHSWHVTLYVSARGLTTLADPARRGRASSWSSTSSPAPWSSAPPTAASGGSRWRPAASPSFYAEVMDALAGARRADARSTPTPNELPDAIAVRRRRAAAAYDPAMAHAFWRALVQIDRVFHRFRTRFLGKCSPGALLLGQLRPGRDALLRPPRAAASRRRSAPAGRGDPRGLFARGLQRRLLAGRRRRRRAGFYSYAYPAPAGFAAATVSPAAARFDAALGEFLLPYEAVRTAADPDAALLAFLQSTYDAAADLARWDRGRWSARKAGRAARARSPDDLTEIYGSTDWRASDCLSRCVEELSWPCLMPGSPPPATAPTSAWGR